MKLFDPTYIRNNVDYSFGDQSGESLQDGYIKNANINNLEFMLAYNKIKQSKSVMTLFIDNIRLYRRPGIKYTSRELTDDYSKHFKDVRVKELNMNNDLLELCGKLTDINFLIFTSFEDTPIDKEIYEKIPENVIGIHSSNSIVFGDKVHPMPYGLQRKLSNFDERQDIILDFLNKEIQPNNLLYINHNVSTNIKRIEINEFFKNKSWVTIDTPTSIGRTDYSNYLTKIKNHKFMICPEGNAIGCECHRDWEVIYMRRVPVVIDSEYLRKIFKGIPVLFVRDFTEITKDLLIENESLYDEIQKFDFNQLDIEQYYNKILKKYNI